MLTVVLPSILTLAIHFAPEDPDFRKLLKCFPHLAGPALRNT